MLFLFIAIYCNKAEKETNNILTGITKLLTYMSSKYK